MGLVVVVDSNKFVQYGDHRFDLDDFLSIVFDCDELDVSRIDEVVRIIETITDDDVAEYCLVRRRYKDGIPIEQHRGSLERQKASKTKLWLDYCHISESLQEKYDCDSDLIDAAIQHIKGRDNNA